MKILPSDVYLSAVKWLMILCLLLAGHRLIKIAKSSISPSVGFFFRINTSGISLLDDEGVEMSGPEANTIHYQGLMSTFCYILYVFSLSFFFPHFFKD